MNRNFLSYSLVAAMLTTSVSFTALADKEDNGAILGAIVGGILGNQVGKGNGKAVATGLGIILGAVVGADIGRDLDSNDRRALEEAQRDAFRRPIGERTDWDGNSYGSRTGARGNFRTTREGYLRTNNREICREYESVIVTRQKTETKTGIACSSANGSWREVTSTEVVFNGRPGNGGNYGGNYGSEPVRPIEPSRPRPRPPVMPTNPNYGYGSLRGYCQDYDHSQFIIAKQFAASYSGPYLSQSEATRWAQEYNNSHRCGTITEYSSRYQALKNLATSYSGLYIGEADARRYAADKADYLTTADVAEMVNTIAKLKNFVTAYNGLYKGQSDASRIARSWTDRNNCENSAQIQAMWDQYTREYTFATSYNGLYLGQTEARNYALDRVSRMSRCSDLLR